MDCLDDNQVAAYVARRLHDGELDAIVDHLSRCDACLAMTCAAATEEAAAGLSVGRYAILEMIGQGGMGSVYIAHDPQLDRRVALKVVRADRRSQGQLQLRMTREARAMAQVRHPNVVTVYDSGELTDGVFIAMELVDGETLAQWLAAKPRAWRDVLARFIDAGNGLAAAHAAGIVHRDFKPENVLVDRDGRVAVTDFGVAALRGDLVTAASTVVDDDAEPEVAMTRTGSLLGTPRYMSPEQLRGERADARSDQFGFAVALYESLYGAPPFAGESLAELGLAVEGQVPAPPRSTQVPASVHRALTRALAAAPARRFPSIGTLLVALGTSGRRSRRWLLAGVGLGLVVATAAIAVLAVRSPAHVAVPATARTTVLVAPFANTTGDAALDDTLDVATAAVLVTSTRLDAMAGVELIGAAGGKPPDIDAIAERRAAAAPNPLALVHGTIRRDGTGYAVAIEARERGSAEALYAGERHAANPDGLLPATAELTRELMRKLGDPAPPVEALSTSFAAIHAYARGQLETLTEEPVVAIASFQRALALDPELSAARAALGLTLYNTARKSEAIVELERAFRTADRIPERQRLMLLGDYYGVVGRYGESILAYQQLLAKWPGDGRAQLNLTATAIDANSWPLALEVARAVAKEHSSYEIVRRNLVLAELGNNRFADAIRDGVALVAEVPHPAGAGVAALAAAYALVGRRDAALAAIATIVPELAPHAQADLAAFAGHLEEAEAALRDRVGADDLMVLAEIRMRRGDRTGAAVAARRSLADDTLPNAYLAASVAVAAGDPADLAARARAWIDSPESDRRMFGQLLVGDLARAEHRAADARAAYLAASRIGDSWLVHDRLARAAIDLGDAVVAERELTWCIDHRGTAALVANPSLFLVPEVYLELARSIDRRGGDARAAYQAVVDLAPEARDDPWTKEARDRLAR